MARNAHTMTVLGTKLYLFGGHSGNKHLKDLHVFDTETLTWTEPQIYGSSPKGSETRFIFSEDMMAAAVL